MGDWKRGPHLACEIREGFLEEVMPRVTLKDKEAPARDTQADGTQKETVGVRQTGAHGLGVVVG